MMTKKILIIGYGYTAQHLSAMLGEADIVVTATTRNPDKIQQWQGSSVNLLLLDSKKLAINLSEYDYILISAPPYLDGKDPVFDLLKDQLIACGDKIKWIGYLSSTSVYGDHEGGWVDEGSRLISPGDRGIRRIKAENSWMSLFDEFKLPIHIFRLAGIYGPNRNALVRIMNGKTTSIIKEGQVFSRIHVEDICRSLYESMKNPTPGEVYNLVDDLPCAPELVDECAAQLLRKPPLIKIPYEEADLSPMMKEFYQCCRKVSNKKFKAKFTFNLRYPSYKEGLHHLAVTECNARKPSG